jgi:hypothetical protein
MKLNTILCFLLSLGISTLIQGQIIIDEFTLKFPDSVEQKTRTYIFDESANLLESYYFYNNSEGDSNFIREERNVFQYLNNGNLIQCETHYANPYGEKLYSSKIEYFYKNEKLDSFQSSGYNYQGKYEFASIKYLEQEIKIILGNTNEVDTAFIYLDEYGRLKFFKHRIPYQEDFMYSNPEYLYTRNSVMKKERSNSILKKYGKSQLLEKIEWYYSLGKEFSLSSEGIFVYKRNFLKEIKIDSRDNEYFEVVKYRVRDKSNFKNRDLRKQISKLLAKLRYGWIDNSAMKWNPIFTITSIGSYNIKLN